MTEAERPRPDLRREHFLTSEGSASEARRTRSFTESDRVGTREDHVTAKENLEVKFESKTAAAGRIGGDAAAGEVEKRVVLLGRSRVV